MRIFYTFLILCDLNALPEVLQASAALLGGPAEVDHGVEVRLALPRLGDTLYTLALIRTELKAC